jgi:hypothetical protein
MAGKILIIRRLHEIQNLFQNKKIVKDSFEGLLRIRRDYLGLNNGILSKELN